MLSSVNIIDTNASIIATLSNVFVMWIKSDTESLVLKRSQSVLMGNLDIGVLDALQSKFLRYRSEVFLLLGLVCHHGELFISDLK